MNQLAFRCLVLTALSWGALSSLGCRPVPSVQRERGSFEITGTVLDAAGRGLAGVLVRAQLSARKPYVGDSKRIDEAPSLDFESAISQATDRHARLLAGTYEAITDEQGEYRVTGLVEGKYNLRAYKQDYWIPMPKGGSLCISGDVVDLVARPVVSVRMQVLMPGGEEAESAAIVFGDKSLPRMRLGPFAWSSTEPVVRVPAGELKLTAVRGAFGYSSWTDHEKADFSSDSLVVHVPDTGLAEPVVFQLKGQNGLRGKVSAGNNADVTWGIQVTLLALRENEAVDLDTLRASDTRLSVQPSGYYVFPNLPSGRFVVGLSRSRQEDIEFHEVVEVTHGFTTLDLTLPDPQPEPCVLVRVECPEGESLSNLRYFFDHKLNGGTRGVRETRPTSISEGQACIPIPAGSRRRYFGQRNDADEFRLVVQHDDFGVAELLLEHGQNHATLRFDVPANLTVKLPGIEDSAFTSRYSMRLEPAGDRTDPLWHVRVVNVDSIDESGTVKLGAVVPGEYKLTLLLRNSGTTQWAGRHMGVSNVRLVAGENHSVVPVPQLFSLDVVVKHGANAALALQDVPTDGSSGGAAFDRANAKCDELGLARFKEVVAGKYRLLARVRKGETYLESVLGDVDLRDVHAKVEAELPELCSFEVQLTEGSGQMLHLDVGMFEREGFLRYEHQWRGTSDSSGKVQFEHIPTGRYELYMSRQGDPDAPRMEIPVLEVNSDLKTVEFAMPETHDFSLRTNNGWEDDEDFAPLRFRLVPIPDYGRVITMSSFNGQSRPDESGIVRFSDVPSGRYSVHTGDGISLPSGIEITVPPEPLEIDWASLQRELALRKYEFSVVLTDAPDDLVVELIGPSLAQLFGHFGSSSQLAEPAPHHHPTRIGPDQRFEFEGLSAGTYTLVAKSTSGLAKQRSISISHWLPVGEIVVDWSDFER